VTLPSLNTPIDWITILDEETRLLGELAEAVRSARHVSMRDSHEAFTRQLTRQSELCRRLESKRDERRARLSQNGRAPEDLFEVVLESVGPDDRRVAQKALDRWIESARAAQFEIDLNKDFYRVALAAVEEAVTIVTGSHTKGYDPRGRGVSAASRPFTAVSL